MTPGFTGNRLDRADRERDDPAAQARAERDPTARLLVLDALEPPVDADGRLNWIAHDGREAIFLGHLDGRPAFLSGAGDATGPAMRSPALMTLLATLPADEMALYAAARSLLDWHGRHRFCANCGHATDRIRAGWARACPSCGAQHFPRTDPVVIMLAIHRDRVLLGRQPSWGPGRYSALAGFVEVGESIEEAVAREVMEEASVAVTNVRYVASQPWPFPSQLMIACVADADGDTIRLDETELEHAFWATRDDVAAALSGNAAAPFIAPPPYAIAHTLLADWLARD